MNDMRESVRVLIVDDAPQVRQGLITMLKLAAKKTTPKIEVVGEAQNGREAIAQTQALRPDVVLMDLEIPILDGYEATHWIKENRPETRVIILSIHASPKEQERACLAGADGFVAKGSDYQELLNAILTNDVVISKE
jgi:DNA-binding NarL/FixJ family response regulator